MPKPNQTKDSYHHGDLKESLIQAAITLIREQGPDHFSMADACKVAGVSKAAPYRHFTNRDDLLHSVIQQGFSLMSAEMKTACAGLVPGSDKRIIKLGMTYVNFAIKEPDLFKLMFGNRIPDMELDENSPGRATFQLLLDEIISRTRLTDVAELMAVALPLWTLVHGASTLTIDNSYGRIYPDNNTEEMIAKSTTQLLAAFPEPKV
jgi:AcrR family transcriptional regulator